MDCLAYITEFEFLKKMTAEWFFTKNYATEKRDFKEDLEYKIDLLVKVSENRLACFQLPFRIIKSCIEVTFTIRIIRRR